MIHDQDRTDTVRRTQDVARDACADSFETRTLHKDGDYRWVSWNVTPIPKERCVYLVGRDITQLKRSQQLFEGILQSAPDAMVIINPEGRIVMVNRQMEHVFGYEQQEMVGHLIEMLVPVRHREKHPSNVARFFAASSVRPMGAGLPLRGLHKDGHEFPADIALSPIETENGKLMAASVRDVSDRQHS